MPDAEYVHTLAIGREGSFDNEFAGGDLSSASAQFNTAANLNKGDYVEFDLYLDVEPAGNLSAVLSDGSNYATAELTGLNKGWNHVVVPVSKFIGTIDSKSVTGISFSGAVSDDTSASVRVAFANFGVTADERAKEPIEYSGTVYSRFSGYNNVTVEAGTDIISKDPIALPVTADLNTVDYIEFNLYVGTACDIILNINSTPEEYGEISDMDSAYIMLDGLRFGWNKVSVKVEDILNANGWTINDWFDAGYITNIYLSGVLSAEKDVSVTVEDFAFVKTGLNYEISAGDYNADGEIDIRDLIHVANAAAQTDGVWFPNAAEFDGADDGIINSADMTALRKFLFTVF